MARGWVHIPSKVLHPRVAPPGIAREHVVVMVQTGEPESLLASAVRVGAFLTVKQLKNIQSHLSFPMCEPGKGSGKNGRLIKKDYCDGLLNYLFPGQDHSLMLKGLMGQNWNHLKPCKACTSDILQAFDGLPPEDQAEFAKLAAVAADEVLLKEKRDERTRAATFSRNAKKHHTPLSLKDLRPPGGRITRHPALKRYQAFYTTYTEAGSLLEFNLILWLGRQDFANELTL